MAATMNPYQTGKLKKAKFHYPPFQVQIMMWLEEAGLVRVLEGQDHPSFGQALFDLSLGMPFGLTDPALYVLAFGSLAYALFLFLKP